MEILLNKLKYRSWHRGTKEADILLGVFFDTNYTKMNKQEFLDYENFLLDEEKYLNGHHLHHHHKK